MTFGSLFAGIGGFDLGFERAGMKCKWQVEIDPFCQKVLEKHWPNVMRHDDIRTFAKHEDEQLKVDCICGGFPCKQTSVAASINGKRTGLNGIDSGLWFEMVRVVDALRPSFVVVENTQGAAAWKDTIKSGLEGAGYSIPQEPILISARDFGAPHRRNRLFWIANLNCKGLSITRPKKSPKADGFEGFATNRSYWGETRPRVLRMDDGIPARMDRIRALGNAVVPQIAEWIASQILTTEDD